MADLSYAEDYGTYQAPHTAAAGTNSFNELEGMFTRSAQGDAAAIIGVGFAALVFVIVCHYAGFRGTIVVGR